MRIAFVLSFFANVLLALASLAILPSEVAIHFGAGGVADDWAPSWFNTLFWLGLDVFIFGSFYFSARLISITPAKWINLPNKGYWLTPENMPRLDAKMSRGMFHLGTAVFVLFFVLGVLTIRANLSSPVRLDERVFWPVFLLFMAYTLAWTVAFYRSLRIPAGER